MPLSLSKRKQAMAEVKAHRAAQRALMRPPRQLASKSYVNKMVFSDRHYLDTRQAGSGVALTGNYVVHLTAVARGDGQQNRTGKKIMLKSLDIRMDAFRNISSTLHDRLRILIVQVKTVNSGTVPATFPINYILNTADLTGTANIASDVAAYRRVSEGQEKTYKVLRDFYIDLGFGTTDKSTRQVRYRKVWKKGLPVWFSDNLGADIARNGIYCMAISDNSSTQPNLEVSSRIQFSP